MWYWCIRCERAQWHDIESKHTAAPIVQCRFSDCDGRLWPYDETLNRFSEIVSGWPSVPEEGKIYPLFSPYRKAFEGRKVAFKDDVLVYLERLWKAVGGGTSRGGGFPRILISEIDTDPETGERVKFSREVPPVWQRPVDVDRNIWWINSASPLARIYLDEAKGHGYNSKEWRVYHLERIIEIMVKIAVEQAVYQGEVTSAEDCLALGDSMTAQMQAHAAATLSDFIDGGTLPRGR